MKDVNRHNTESFVLRKGLLWALIPKDKDHCPLLTQLCGDDPAKTQVTWEDWPSLEVALSNIRETALGLGMSVTVCGNYRKQPTIILRKKAGSNPVQAMTDQSINLKWCLFGEHRATWLDHECGQLLEAIERIEPGKYMRILSAPSKECRHADVFVERTGQASWKISGVMTDDWDDVHDLADTYKVLLTEQLNPEDGEPPDEEDERSAFLAAYNARKGTAYQDVMSENEWRGLVPMTGHTGEPGVSLEFERRVRGGVDRLIKVLSDIEGQLIERAKREEQFLANIGDQE